MSDEANLATLVEGLGRLLDELPGVIETSAVVELPSGYRVTVRVFDGGRVHVQPVGQGPIEGRRPR